MRVDVQVDATEDANKDLAGKFGVRGYPTLKVFRDGDASNAEDYEGPRDADGIFKHVKKISGPASVAVETAEAVAALIEAEDAPVVAYFSALEGDAFDAYMKQANGLRNDFSFAHTTDASALKVSINVFSREVWQIVSIYCCKDREGIPQQVQWSVQRSRLSHGHVGVPGLRLWLCCCLEQAGEDK
jgi:hypothetical protein